MTKSWNSLSQFSSSLILLSFPAIFFSRFYLFLLDVSSCNWRQLVLVAEKLLLTRGVAVSQIFLSYWISTFLFLLVLLLLTFIQQLNMNKAVLIILLVCIVLAQIVEHKNPEEEVQELKRICQLVDNSLQSIQSQMRQVTDKINNLLIAGHIDYKDQFKPKPQKIVALNKQIEQHAKKIQQIYDNKIYLQYCLVFDEEMLYKQHNSTEIQSAISKLTLFTTLNQVSIQEL